MAGTRKLDLVGISQTSKFSREPCKELKALQQKVADEKEKFGRSDAL